MAIKEGFTTFWLGVARSVVDQCHVCGHKLNRTKPKRFGIPNLVAHTLFQRDSKQQGTKFIGFQVCEIYTEMEASIVIKRLNVAICWSASHVNEFFFGQRLQFCRVMEIIFTPSDI